jgi:hypothetical protein
MNPLEMLQRDINNSLTLEVYVVTRVNGVVSKMTAYCLYHCYLCNSNNTSIKSFYREKLASNNQICNDNEQNS